MIVLLSDPARRLPRLVVLPACLSTKRSCCRSNDHKMAMPRVRWQAAERLPCVQVGQNVGKPRDAAGNPAELVRLGRGPTAVPKILSPENPSGAATLCHPGCQRTA